jgi:hypothetical protein
VLNSVFIPTSGLGRFIRDIYDPNPSQIPKVSEIVVSSKHFLSYLYDGIGFWRCLDVRENTSLDGDYCVGCAVRINLGFAEGSIGRQFICRHLLRPNKLAAYS